MAVPASRRFGRTKGTGRTLLQIPAWGYSKLNHLVHSPERGQLFQRDSSRSDQLRRLKIWGQTEQLCFSEENMGSKPKTVTQVLSVPPFTTERSPTKHMLPTSSDQGETWSKSCNQWGNKGDGVSNNCFMTCTRGREHQELTPAPESIPWLL